jgi:hypothetical protein
MIRAGMVLAQVVACVSVPIPVASSIIRKPAISTGALQLFAALAAIAVIAVIHSIKVF